MLIKKPLSRRAFLSGSALFAGAAALSHPALFGVTRAFAQDNAGDDDVQTIINLAATAELFATTHYLAAINNAAALGFDGVVLDYMKAGFLAEQDHLELLQSLGATPVVTEFYVPENLFSDVALFSETTETAETVFVAAYLAATRIFAGAGAPEFAVTTSQIAATEAEHRALVRQIGGRLATNQSYAQYLFPNVSDAVPLLQPFLDGSGAGFVGPITPPTADDIAAVRAEADAIGYTTVMPYAAIAASASASSSSSAVMATAGTQDVNIRREPSISAPVIGVLGAGQSTGIDGQRTVGDFVWWRRVDGGWIRSDAVSETAGADALPEV